MNAVDVGLVYSMMFTIVYDPSEMASVETKQPNELEANLIRE